MMQATNRFWFTFTFANLLSRKQSSLEGKVVFLGDLGNRKDMVQILCVVVLLWGLSYILQMKSQRGRKPACRKMGGNRK